MNYIDPAKYKEHLENFAKGTPKQVLKEGYVDLKPLGTFEGKITDIGATVNQTYPDAKSMEEAEGITNPGKYKPKSYDLDGDGVPNGADKAPKDGMKHEGRHNLGNLSQDELTELKAYIESMKTTKKAIEELLDKAKGMRSEGGDNTALTLAANSSDTSGMSGGEEEEDF